MRDHTTTVVIFVQSIDYQPGVPGDTDYIVIDTGHRYSEIRIDRSGSRIERRT